MGKPRGGFRNKSRLDNILTLLMDPPCRSIRWYMDDHEENPNEDAVGETAGETQSRKQKKRKNGRQLFFCAAPPRNVDT